jgi:hypothetical protein
MAVIDELDLNTAVLASAKQREVIQNEFVKGFWIWYHLHENDRVLKVGFLFIQKTVRVRDLRQVFVLFFGPSPV